MSTLLKCLVLHTYQLPSLSCLIGWRTTCRTLSAVGSDCMVVRNGLLPLKFFGCLPRFLAAGRELPLFTYLHPTELQVPDFFILSICGPLGFAVKLSDNSLFDSIRKLEDERFELHLWLELFNSRLLKPRKRLNKFPLLLTGNGKSLVQNNQFRANLLPLHELEHLIRVFAYVSLPPPSIFAFFEYYK